MNNSVHHALEGLLYGFTDYNGTGSYEKQLIALQQIIITDKKFEERVANLDAWLDQNPKFEALGDYLFDLLMAQFIRTEGTSESFFDSKEWDKIEDDYAERGTELLDAITYLDESQEIEVTPSIEDFIFEYLLVENDPDKETLTLYEPLIRHKELVDGILEELVEETAHEKENTLGPMLQALLVFFSEPKDVENIPTALNDIGGSNELVSALACCLLFYNQGLDGSRLV
jgi:hypothetical protein